MPKEIISIITGDIVNSRSLSPSIWLKSVKTVIKRNKIGSKKWEIFQGDMFQIETSPERSLKLALELKSSVKVEKDLDVRLAIGLGTKNYNSDKVSESNGEAYINSGISFDNLKKRRLAINTPWEDFNEEWNIILQLASLTMDNWAPMTSIIFKEALTKPKLTQKDIAKKLKRTQGRISEGLKRAGYDEIINILELYEKQVIQKIK